MADDAKKRLLEYAAGRLGLKELAARLKVPEKTVEEWLHGSPDMTNSKALALADLINDLTKSKS
jgi:plasmid maintenance system antidote protein VapI